MEQHKNTPAEATRDERFVTQREAEVLSAVRQRMSNSEIADTLTISVRTVESHVSALLAKFGVTNRVALANLAEEFGTSWLRDLEPPSALLRMVDFGSFVGRVDQMRDLTRCWALAKEGSPQVAFLAGESGIGKTRLAAEFARSALSDGAVVMFGRCDVDRQGPFEAIGDALAPYVTVCPQQRLHADVQEVLADLARIMPSLGSRLPRPGTFQSDAKVARMRLFEAVNRLLRGAADLAPVLFVIDDLQWAPPPTLNLLKFLIRGRFSGAIMFLGTYHEESQAPELAAFLADVRRDSVDAQLSLESLSQFDVAQLVHESDDSSVEARDALALEIYAETRGNPFFAVEVIRNLRESGGGMRGETQRTVPAGLQGVIEVRANRLSEDAHRVLRIAAVLGQEFELQVLEDVAEVAENALVDCVEEAETANLIIDVTDGSGSRGTERYSFAHGIVRHIVLSSLSPARRRRLHARAARAIEERYPDSLEERADEIARHLIEAGHITDARQTLRYLTMAGRAALNAAAPEEALRFFRRAEGLLEFAEVAEVVELSFQIGLAERSLGRWMDAVASWRESLRLAAELGDAALIARTAVAAHHNIVFALRTSEARQLTEEALGALGPDPSSERGRLLGSLSFSSAWSGDYETFCDAIEEELKIAAALADDSLRGHGLAMKTLGHTAFLEHRAAVKSCDEAIGILRRTGDTWTLSSMLGFMCFALVGLGRFAEARAAGAELMPLSERVGNYAAIQQWTRMEAMIHFFERGDVAALEYFAASDLQFCRAVGIELREHSLTWLGLAKFLGGDWAEAETYLEAANSATMDSAMVGWAWSHLYEFHAYAGNEATAARLLSEHASNLPVSGQANTTGSWTMALAAAEGQAVLGNFPDSASLLPVIEECIETTGAVCNEYCGGRILARAAGISAAAGGDWEKAERYFTTARRQAERMPHLVEVAHTLRMHGAMLWETATSNEHARANTLLRQAEEIYGRLGMPQHQAMCATRLATGRLGHA